MVSADLSIGRLEWAPRSHGLDKLALTTFSANKFRSTSAKGARRFSTPRARNELKPALDMVHYPIGLRHLLPVVMKTYIWSGMMFILCPDVWDFSMEILASKLSLGKKSLTPK
ncbi:hypothetical protein TNCV_4247691 [Trichonephila clavipes]|nr:hypothetical protein TNCV_4247691 [Trichonephila clavipes]